MREADLLRFEWVADPRISPDGSRIAFTHVRVDEEADEYRTHIAVVGAGAAAPRALTHGPYDSQPRWSPDGRTLAFVRVTEPKQPGQIHLLPMSGGEPTALAKLERGASEPAWSPDGRRIAFLSGTRPEEAEKLKPRNEPGRVVTRPMFRMNNEGFIDFEHLDHVWVVDVDGGTPRQLTTGRFKEESPRWSRDGGRIWFTSDRRPEPWFGPEQASLYAVAADRREPTTGDQLETIAEIQGPITAFVADDSGRIAAVGGVRPEPPRSYDQNDLLLFEPPYPGRSPRVLTREPDLEAGGEIIADQHAPRGGGEKPLAFSADGRAVLAVFARRGSAFFARVGIADGAVEPLTGPQYEVIAGSVTPDGRHAALVLGDLTHPGVLYRLDVESRKLEPLWDPNRELLASMALGEVEEIEYPSFDGRSIHGWIVKPSDFDPTKKYPMVLQIHGGPHAAYGVGFFHEFRVLAAAGYVVLYTNPRGSTSYGQEFADVIQYRYPGDDHRDLMAGVDHVIARGYVDEKRLGITGGSGGGLLTNWAIARTDRFAAAITQRCVADWASMYYSCDFTLFTPSWFRRPPFEDPAEYLERSPAHFASRITTPLMVIHAEEDWRTPIGQGETMFRALMHQKKPVVMVRFPGENHELSRSGTPSRRVQNQQHIRRWFDRHLLGASHPEYDA